MRPARLPVSGIVVMLRPVTGNEDMMILEAPVAYGLQAELDLLVALAERLAEAPQRVSWCDLPAVDLDTLLLRLRQGVIGDRVQGEIGCAVADCGERVEISFGIEAFIRHFESQMAPPPPAEIPGWFRLRGEGEEGRFRLPTPRDLSEAASAPRPEWELARRCIHPAPAKAVQLRRAERAMEAVAPLGARDLSGRCPSCGTPVAAEFDIRSFCLRELRRLASAVYEHVDLLARSYRWSEASILALGSARRARYAERLRAAAMAA